MVRKKINRLIGKKELFFTREFLIGKEFTIGEYTYGKPQVLFKNSGHKLFIGKFCSIAEDVKIFLGGNHRTDWITTYPFNSLPEYFPESNKIKGHPASKGDVEIGNDVWIGRGAMVLSGVSVGNGAVIGAGAVVSSNVGAYEIWAGNPARFIKKRFSDEEIDALQKIKWWDWEINKIKANTHLLCNNDIKELMSKHV